ncbi:hypothetical protein [Amycolatopsis jejuensis]|uniref:hypothetical protein n=1 Tax=Amycolatopsis jejuensis TaxID=330084 RepID=UPI00052648B8|nr:hypothetical protein [Amycolatopsis jejuensis]
MKIAIDVHSAQYAPWNEGDEERERIGEDTESRTFDSARECADWLDREGFGDPSESGPVGRFTWLSELDPYENPEGVLTERSAHVERDSPGFSPRLWAAIVAVVSRRWTRYAGPYYVEQLHA